MGWRRYGQIQPAQPYGASTDLPRAYSPEEDFRLMEMSIAGARLSDIATALHRLPGSVSKRRKCLLNYNRTWRHVRQLPDELNDLVETWRKMEAPK